MNDRSRPALSTYLPLPLRALLWIRLYILLLPSWKVRVFSIMILVYGDETLTLHPPPIWKTRYCDLSVFSPKNCSAQLKPSGTKVPSGIAFRITMACRPRHHIKAQLLRRCTIKEHWRIMQTCMISQRAFWLFAQCESFQLLWYSKKIIII